MRKHGVWIIAVLAVLCLIFLFGHGSIVKEAKPQSGQEEKPQPEYVSESPILNCKYYNSKDFMSSVAAAGSASRAGATTGTTSGTIHSKGTASRMAPKAGSTSETSDDKGIIAGGIVPHHLLAGKMIASFFKDLSESSPDTLIILAPNHGRIGHNSINTSLLGWSTDLGTLENDTVLTNRIISKTGASQDNILMEEEHSISSLIPFIKYYMPKVKIVPVLLHGNYPTDKSIELGIKLAGELSISSGISDTSTISGTSRTSDSSRTAIIASVDFSHYLDAVTADKMDEKTLSAIKTFDIKSIGMMGNDNLDSPPSIITLLSAMKELQATSLEVTGHDNSSAIAGKGADYTTSYFTLLFRSRSR